jgi:hypothetical protein
MAFLDQSIFFGSYNKKANKVEWNVRKKVWGAVVKKKMRIIKKNTATAANGIHRILMEYRRI